MVCVGQALSMVRGFVLVRLSRWLEGLCQSAGLGGCIENLCENRNDRCYMACVGHLAGGQSASVVRWFVLVFCLGG